MNHRYPYDPSVEYLEEGVRGNGRGRLTNACVIGILRGDKKKRIGLRKQLSCDREARLISRNRESFVKSRKGELLRNILLSTAKYFFWHPTRPTQSTSSPYGLRVFRDSCRVNLLEVDLDVDGNTKETIFY